MVNEFKNKAIELFQQLNWKPAAPDQLSKPSLVVWGNLNSAGEGVVCVIDEEAKLFKVELNQRSTNEVIKLVCVVRYVSDKEALNKLTHYLDSIGGFYKEVWLGG